MKSYRSVAASAALLLLMPFTATLAQTAAGATSDTPSASDSSPLFASFNGARLGMSHEDVRKALGKPKEADDAQDFFELSQSRRIRVYYDSEGKAKALVATYIGSGSSAPTPEAILGTTFASAADGSGSGTVDSPDGYRISYSRTAGDPAMVFITVQKK